MGPELEQRIDGEMPNEFRDKENGIDQVEPESSKERTRELEIKANFEILRREGFAVFEEDIRDEIMKLPEVKDFDFYLYIPKDTVVSEVVSKTFVDFDGNSTLKSSELDLIEMPRRPEKAYAIAARYNQGPDENSLGENAKSAEEYEKTDNKYMTPLERIFAEMRWMKENHTHMDERGATMFPGCRTKHKEVPFICVENMNEKVSMNGYYPSESHPDFGVRQVITAETKTETEEK